MTIKKIFLLTSSSSKKKFEDNKIEELTSLIRQKNLDFEIFNTTSKEELKNISRINANLIADNSEYILMIIGQDQDLNSVVNGILASKFPKTPIAFLPSIPTNFQKAASLPIEPKEFLNNLLSHNTSEKIDLGSYYEINHQEQLAFIDNVSIGMEATFFLITSNSKLKKIIEFLHLTKIAYAFNFIRSFFIQGPFEVNFKADYRQQVFYNAFFVGIANQPYFGRGINLLSRASLTNNKLDLIIIEKPKRFGIFKLFFQFLKPDSLSHSPYFHFFEASNITLQSKSIQPGQLDGLELGSKSFDLKFELKYFYLKR